MEAGSRISDRRSIFLCERAQSASVRAHMDLDSERSRCPRDVDPKTSPRTRESKLKGLDIEEFEP